MVTNNELDLDKLEALARAATPGPWQWHECMDGDRMAELRSRSNALICDFGCDGKVAVEGTEPDAADMQFMAGLNPATALQLIELARRSTSGSDTPAPRSLNLKEVACPKCELKVISSCGANCPVPDRYGRARMQASGSDGTAAAGAVVMPRELAQRCLSSMKHAVTFCETGRGRPPSQTCMFEIKELEAVLNWSAATSGSELAGGSVLDIAARIFDFKPHKQTEEVKAKYLCFANEVIAQQAGAHADCGTYECKAGQRDGVICADGECDIASGQRAAPAPAAEEVRDEKYAADLAWSLAQQPKPAQKTGCGGSREFVGNMPCPGCDACHGTAMSASQGKTGEAK